MSDSCNYFRISRSGYYASCQEHDRETIEESVVVELVQNVRKKLPRVGGKKLFRMLNDDLKAVGKIGRDRFFKILRNKHLLVARKKSYTRTTHSYHHFHKHRNLLPNIHSDG